MMAIVHLSRTTACILGLSASTLSAQSSLPLDGRRLSAGVDSFTVTYGGQTIGRSIQATDSSTEGGSRVWRQAYAFYGAGGDVSTDTLIMDRLTLRPLREARVSSAGRFAFRFGANQVEVTQLSDSGATSATRVPLVRPAYSSAALDPIVRALPLALGMTAEIDLYYPPPAQRGASRVTARVLRDDEVAVGQGTRQPAWVVVIGAPGEATTFWIAKNTRQVLQFDTQQGAATIEFRR
jgi:hypothetical protein